MSFYHTFRNGRRQAIPDPETMGRQKFVLYDLLNHFAAHPCCHGFVRGRSPETALAPHLGCKYLLHLDIANAFPSVTREQVYFGLVRVGMTPELIEDVLELCLDGDSLPVGAPTSPALFNLALRSVDDELCDFGTYTRYADNILLSATDFIPSEGEARVVIRERGYRINERKSWLRVRGRQSLEVFGYVVGVDSLRRPRRVRHNERAAEWNPF